MKNKIPRNTQQLLFNTVIIEAHDGNNDLIGTGTSFIVSDTYAGKEELFLVTNKHVIEGATIGYIQFTEIENDMPQIGKIFPVRIDGFQSLFFLHPNTAVDIAVMPISWQLDLIQKDNVKAYLSKIDTNIFISEDELNEFDVTREVIFVGYPNGLFDEINYTPIVRTGTIATPIQFDFSGEPVFIIDASVFPGSSGSPVFSYDRTLDSGFTNIKLLGIISAVFTQEDNGSIILVPAPTQMMPLVEFKHMIDLGVVYKSKLIKETINLCFQNMVYKNGHGS